MATIYPKHIFKGQIYLINRLVLALCVLCLFCCFLFPGGFFFNVVVFSLVISFSLLIWLVSHDILCVSFNLFSCFGEFCLSKTKFDSVCPI